ncbi:putative Transcriptional regulator, LysR family [Vibrio nigripulchritudo SOn1]|uniref:Transcriptional regulator, LysR family n=1 Tax=Vibrio nigripulchritudo SOn1 TaxID=1238450 RepID=A0AAV2VPH4_9VIBR|nr:LysR family transcriptional regulator [Vibrio nigripulchritudo]CCO46433.1 putative Transcriptional regulator, LysR family [Vibrio nigripulchritudo SOn1]
MDNHQLRTFVAVAQEGSITRASERLFLSQPAVSAHIKALESSLSLTLFERTPQGMRLTLDGQRILIKAEQTLKAHQDLLEEARKIQGQIAGIVNVGASSHTPPDILGKLIMYVAERFPDVEIKLQQLPNADIVRGIKNGNLDAGIYNDIGQTPEEFYSATLTKTRLLLATSPHLPDIPVPVDWSSLQHLPWIYPGAETCCGKAAEALFEEHGFRPSKLISVDREKVTRTLIAGGLGIGLIHQEKGTAEPDDDNLKVICDIPLRLRTMFVCLNTRQNDPLIQSLIGAIT